MVIMTAEQSATFLPRGRAFSFADLAAMPDDGNRYELIDGTLLVTPAPSWRHQAAVAALWQTLQQSCPPDLRAFVAPLTVTYADDTAVEPDVLVVRRSDLGERFLEGAPVLVVEVLSPSTRHIDLAFKRACYEAARCPAYWVIDPLQPSIICWQLSDGEYREVARAVGAESVTLGMPFPVTISPAALIE